MKNNQVEDFYDHYTDRQIGAGINKRHLSIINKIIQHGLRKDHNVLEIGCGIGTLTELLSNYLKYGSVLGLDLSIKSIEIAKNRLSHKKNIALQPLDVVEKEIKGQYDVIVLPDVIEHIPIESHEALFKKLSNCINDEGLIFIHIPNPYYLEWCHENKPEILQIIDQPIYTNVLLEKLYKSNLYLHFLETYSIWVDNHDYQFIILKKAIKKEFDPIEEKITLREKLMFRIKKLFSK